MRHLPADKYNVAWFKLAEFVVRGEKERALGMYRLLMHSINDRALALQLEGDLLLSFNDEAAAMKYRLSAQAYREEQRIMEAIAVYEHLVSCKTSTSEDLHKLLELYQEVGIHNRVALHLEELSNQLLINGRAEQAIQLIQQYQANVNSAELARLYHRVVQALAQTSEVESSISNYLSLCVNALTASSFVGALQTFLTTLQTTNPHLHEEALRMLQP